MKVISPLDGGGQEVISTLIQGGCNFILRPTLLILEPPLQIIIAQSLRLHVAGKSLVASPNVGCFLKLVFLTGYNFFFQIRQ